MSHRNLQGERGFTLVESLAAILVLSIGMVGMAALMSKMM